MVPPEKWQNSLRALNHVLVITRHFCNRGASLADLADIMDAAEYLPRLLADEKDRTMEFRRQLEDLTARWSEFGPALLYLDDASVRWPW